MGCDFLLNMEDKKKLELLEKVIDCGKEVSLEIAKTILDHYKVDLKGTEYVDEFIEIGIDYDRFGEHEKALKIYKKAMNRALAIGDRQGLGSIYSNMGIAYNGMQNFDKALEFYNKSMEIVLESNNEQEMAILYNNIGYVYKNILKYQEAGEYYIKALGLFTEANDKFNMTACYYNLAELFSILKDYEMALEYIEKCVKIDQELDLPILKKDMEFRDLLQRRKNKASGKAGSTTNELEEDDEDKLEDPKKKKGWRLWGRK